MRAPALLFRRPSVALSRPGAATALPARIAVCLALLAAPISTWAQPGPGGPRLVVIRDAETETLLRNFANPLFRAAGVDPNLVRLILIRDDALNAFVSTGNRMFINTGLLTRTAAAQELIGVIAHETGHIASGHVSRLPEAMREAMVQSIAALLIGAAAAAAGGRGGGEAGIGAAVGAQQMAQRTLMRFTRGMEQSADQGALLFLDRLGWSSRGIVELFRRLEDQTALMVEQQDPYLLTHPLTRDRIGFVRDHMAKSAHANAGLPAGFEQGYQMVREKLRGFLEPSSITLRRLREGDPAPPSRYARAIALHRLGRTDEAIRLIDGLLAELPSSPWLHELKGQVLFEGGRGTAALVPYREAARLAPGQPQIRAALARAIIETGDPAQLRQAIGHLQSALAREHDDPDSWRSLATAWGRLGDLGQANLALAEEAMVMGDIPRARWLARQAEKLLPPGPSRLRAGDVSNAVKKANREGF